MKSQKRLFLRVLFKPIKFPLFLVISNGKTNEQNNFAQLCLFLKRNYDLLLVNIKSNSLCNEVCCRKAGRMSAYVSSAI